MTLLNYTLEAGWKHDLFNVATELKYETDSSKIVLLKLEEDKKLSEKW